ncbi:ABC transporter ATP-binding protein [Achromobacter aegrifaciens]
MHRELPRDATPAAAALLQVEHLVKDYPVRGKGMRRGGTLRAVDDVSFTLEKGRTLSIVGESGSGKSTVARMVMRLLEPTQGRIKLNGQDWLALPRRELRLARQRIQLVFQDPFSSINPRMRVAEVIGEPLHNFNIARGEAARARVVELLEQVGLSAAALTRYPHEFSGGQRQRIVIARALASNPDLIVCDEAVSALDVSIQAQILNVLARIQEQMKVSYLFISHDLAVVQHISDEVAVMYKGSIVETGTTREIYSRPRHAYTERLLDSVPGQRLKL